MMKEQDKKEEDIIELRSEEFQEVLSGIPPWILRWGITTVAIIVVILLIGSSIFKYPDTITSTITLTGSKPAANIVAKSSGKLQELFVKDNQLVQPGDYLAVIENPAKTADILSEIYVITRFNRFIATKRHESGALPSTLFILLPGIIPIYPVQKTWVLSGQDRHDERPDQQK